MFTVKFGLLCLIAFFSPATFNTVSFSLHFSNCNYLGLRYGFLHILFIEFVKIFEYVELEFSSSLQLHHHNFYTICLHTSFWTPIIYICPQLLSCVRLFVTPWTPLAPGARLLCPRDFPVKSTGVGSHSFLQGIFLTQRLNPGLPILYCLSHEGSLKCAVPKLLCVFTHAELCVTSTNVDFRCVFKLLKKEWGGAQTT